MASGTIYSASGTTQADLAIVATGNLAPSAISAGQYVIWNGSLYTAKTAIASGATLSTSNLTAVSSGGLNDLKASVDSLNSDLTAKRLDITATPADGVTIRNFDVYQTVNIIRVILYFDASSNISNNGTIVTLSETLPMITGSYVYTNVRSLSGVVGAVSIAHADRTKITAWGTLQAGTYYYADFMYIIRP